MKSNKNISIQSPFSQLLDVTEGNFSAVSSSGFYDAGRKIVSRTLLVLFLWMSCQLFSQQTIIKSFSSDAKSVEISTEGLDEIIIQNSENDQIEVSLFDENPNAHHIIVEDKKEDLKISFELDFLEDDSVFRKYITKRLNRASIVVKLPKNKGITVLGTTIDVISKNYNGNLSIYIDKGYVNLNEVQQNVDVKLFQGTISATVSNSNIDIKSTNGQIVVNEKTYLKKYKKATKNVVKIFSVSSINANVTITTQ